MDPDANLDEQRQLAEYLVEVTEVTDTDDVLRLLAKSQRLAELVTALDEWLRRGGFLPVDWRRR